MIGQATLTIAGTLRVEAQVTDESFGGIGLLFDLPVDVHPGELVGVVYEGVEMSAVVRYTRIDRWKHQHVGIEWQTAAAAADSCHNALAAIEGRMFMMFRMLETGGLDEMARAAQQLRDEAASIGAADVADHAALLGSAIIEQRDDQSIIDAIDRLIQAITGANV
ncbi:MAG: hypothetical protein KDA63_15835 [Planctomycetales bacterium]|nr:hypothetical protein [Planctomycetales bacterium]